MKKEPVTRPEPSQLKRITIVGLGVIGGGWAAHFLRQGLDVAVWDPAPDAERKVRDFVAGVWPRLERLGLSEGAAPERLAFVPDLVSAVKDAEFIQENAPENLETKCKVLADIDAAAPTSAVIASSTSGFAMTDMQARCRHPERTVVGHPFNPPYLIPLVEVVGGKQTDPAVVDWTTAVYTHFGKYALKMTRELSGFLGNRLQEAVWREALHMVAAGEATVEEIDAAIAYGPGLRWALMGPCLTFHLAGGSDGMAHMLDHFGPALLEPWTRLTAPELTPELRDRMVNGCLREANGRSVRELENERDEFLIELLGVLEKHWVKWGKRQCLTPVPSPDDALWARRQERGGR
jgi:carnitine 3-dehydrogenase